MVKTVCLLREEKDGFVTARCGRKTKRQGQRLVDLDMSGWDRDVTCPECRKERS